MNLIIILYFKNMWGSYHYSKIISCLFIKYITTLKKWWTVFCYNLKRKQTKNVELLMINFNSLFIF